MINCNSRIIRHILQGFKCYIIKQLCIFWVLIELSFNSMGVVIGSLVPYEFPLVDICIQYQ